MHFPHGMVGCNSLKQRCGAGTQISGSGSTPEPSPASFQLGGLWVRAGGLTL